MPSIELSLHDERVGIVEPARDKTRVTLNVDGSYRQSILLSESFATLAGRRPLLMPYPTSSEATSLRATIVSAWVIRQNRAAEIVTSTLEALNAALAAVRPPRGASPGMVERLQWNADRLLAGSEISEPKR